MFIEIFSPCAKRAFIRFSLSAQNVSYAAAFADCSFHTSFIYVVETLDI